MSVYHVSIIGCSEAFFPQYLVRKLKSTLVKHKSVTNNFSRLILNLNHSVVSRPLEKEPP